MAKKISLSKEIKEKIEEVIIKFNKEELKNKHQKYFPEYRGKYLYLKILEPGDLISPVSRLKYTGDFENWEFAIYKWSRESYFPDECFPGDELFDGTIKGAMKAGYKAYYDN